MKTKALVLLLISVPPLWAFYVAIAFNTANQNNGSIVSSGVTREYLLHVPPRYDHAKPLPLVLSFHGAGSWPAQQMEMSRWNALADREPFIVVYPWGAKGPGPRIWHVEPSAGFGMDMRFISDLIDKLEASYNIDRDRIYANGFSNGGGMSFALSCTMPDRIAAYGAVGSAQTLPFSWCRDRHAAPAIVIHGTRDPVAPFGGGGTWISSRVFPSIPEFTKRWARRNGCALEPDESRVAADVMRRTYSHCTNDASVVLYSVEGGGHTWPGGQPLPEFFCGRTATSLDATSVMWEFFKAHPRKT